ncbi:hypothetical protein LV478_02945 [Komagataeibacter oboediens]|uniref:Uncharacterized protein n=1 Tax=Acetobacter garciniae TaxID=2817435 RepID=A0A939HLM5_9PROT|nr:MULTISPECIES: hypothetical protein [Acetobacteraceae]MBO1325035.1 hypothetical protein [Acetobacter garciniae]MBX0344994.1 hypothetical protein [Acetobacter garciniae]WEQ52536.1 hypothetical protein LV478_02945 [Komagataeibacter oboediens]WNM08710.1 hypothetical protein RI056_00605 [Komagataeibacter nataicola]
MARQVIHTPASHAQQDAKTAVTSGNVEEDQQILDGVIDAMKELHEQLGFLSNKFFNL